jgi:hypothetical protein
MSPEEEAELNDRVKLLGYRTKQDYLIYAVLHNEVNAVGNALMLVQFRKDLREILTELKRLNSVSEMDEELMTPVRTMLEILQAFQEKPKKQGKQPVMQETQYSKMMHLQKLERLMAERKRQYE